MTYAEFLKSQGASDEDVKVLDTPISQRAYAAQAALATQASADAAAAVAARDKYKADADKWYEEVAQPNLTKAQADAIKANAEAARLRTLVLASTDESLRAVAAEMGYKPDGSSTGVVPPKPGASDFDANKYFTKDDIIQIARKESQAIAIAQDIAAEHRALFPDKPLNFRQLREQAESANKPLEQLWMDTYGVPAAREAAAKATREAHENLIRKEEREKVTAELLNNTANPNMVPGGASSSPFVPRPKAGREDVPWKSGIDGENGSGDRVSRAAKNWADRAAGRAN